LAEFSICSRTSDCCGLILFINHLVAVDP
jgi:hypothetical protein